MRKLQTPELYAFQGFLSAMEAILAGAKYHVWLGASLFDLEDSQLSINALLQLDRPGYQIPEAAIIESNIDEMNQRIQDCLKLSNPPYPSTNLIEVTEGVLYRMYQRYLSRCIGLSGKDAIILERDESINPDHPEVRWYFDYIIHERLSGRRLN